MLAARPERVKKAEMGGAGGKSTPDLASVECRACVADYIRKYNAFRSHSSVGEVTPDMAYHAA